MPGSVDPFPCTPHAEIPIRHPEMRPAMTLQDLRSKLRNIWCAIEKSGRSYGCMPAGPPTDEGILETALSDHPSDGPEAGPHEKNF
jgi:hypothetical protein